ncbi:hypothetical protein E1A91_A11G240500v1 [Gossypium mustelinum]|uniref:Exosome complex component RRP4 homolog n=4 Tax=Gossypium TaxID=3633 RepID=A0A1U8HXX9_GOSHI|nr:exosome complex component RRP4 homolog [Gossypium hirsutum]KAB2058400.1 hypothetical protein ES319_A11G233100v1 [Gossypium barbadense]TYJ10917.1 hypothetical protein E1A91_A11G240500v1 [Gossypium mustelinum]
MGGNLIAALGFRVSSSSSLPFFCFTGGVTPKSSLCRVADNKDKMRGLKLPLSQTQRVRLQRAFEKLQSLSAKANSDASVTVADAIPVNYEDAFLKGYGTTDLNGELVATVCGVVERVNKLVYVRALRARYKPEVGDVVVGRVVEVAQKRWRLEINFSQDAVLMLSSMNMPDGIQRRRTALDELNMRSIFEENDIVCAEVRNFQHDGSLQLQARSQKYGKLEKGQLLIIDPYLVRKSKQHFHHLEQFGIDLILGRNGYIWIGEHVEARDSMVIDQAKSIEQSTVVEGINRAYTPLEMRQNICRIANAIRVLTILGFNVDLNLIMETVELSSSLKIDIHDMLGSEFHVLVAEMEAERRSLTTKRKR